MLKRSLVGLTAAACGAVLAAPASAAHEDQLRRVFTAERGAVTPGWLVAAFAESDEFMALTGTR